MNDFFHRGSPTEFIVAWLRSRISRRLVRLLNKFVPGRLRRPRILGANLSFERLPRHRSELLNLVAGIRAAKKYLEIGVHRGLTFERIGVDWKTGIEPFPQFDVKRLPARTQIFVGNSDEYFRTKPEHCFDLIFLDGLHSFSQVSVDFVNCLSVLSQGGVIAIDDTWPRDEVGTAPDQALAMKLREEAQSNAVEWWGDVWKLVWALEQLTIGLKWATVTQTASGEDLHGITFVWKTSADQPLHVEQLTRFANVSFVDCFPDNYKAPKFLHPVNIAELTQLLS